MRTITDYIDLAVQKQGLPTRNRLNLLLQAPGSITSFWTSGRTLPSERYMVQLADLAGISREEALIDLATWRCKDESARNTWVSLRSELAAFRDGTHPDTHVR